MDLERARAAVDDVVFVPSSHSSARPTSRCGKVCLYVVQYDLNGFCLFTDFVINSYVILSHTCSSHASNRSRDISLGAAAFKLNLSPSFTS